MISISSNILTQFINRILTGGSFVMRYPLLINSINEFKKAQYLEIPTDKVLESISHTWTASSNLEILTSSNHTYYTNILAIYGLVGFAAMIFLFSSIFIIGFKKRNIYQKLMILFFFLMPITSPIYFFLPISLALSDKKENNNNFA